MSVLLANLKGDKIIWAVVIILAVFSVLAVYSATGTLAYKYQDGNTEYYMIRHLMLLLAGFGIMYLSYFTHYMRYNQLAPILLTISVPLLMYTLFFGSEINDARRWISLPIVGISFQTSDLAKLALLMYLARAITIKQEYIKDFKSAFLPIIAPVLLICGLIAPADLSSSLILFFVCVLMMFIGRVDMKFIALLLLLGVVVFAILIIIGNIFPDLVRVDTWVNRMRDFLTNDQGSYQIQQSKIAISEGGLFGVGPGNSTQRNYLPHPYSDFIYAIIIEEYGLFGGFVVMGLYLLLMLRCISLVTRSPKAFGAMLVMGLCMLLVVQALMNMAVSVNLVPVTGLTLPLISMGGTSLFFTSFALGMILSVSKYIEKINIEKEEQQAIDSLTAEDYD